MYVCMSDLCMDGSNIHLRTDMMVGNILHYNSSHLFARLLLPGRNIGYHD